VTETRDGSGSPVTADLVTQVLGEDLNPHPVKVGGLTMSALGGCRRYGAYLEAGVDMTNPQTSHPAAMLGGFIHEGTLPRLAATIPGAVTEEAVEWTPYEGAAPVRGRLDLAAPGIVVDLKTMSEWKMERFLDHGPQRGHRWQAHGYGEARVQAGQEVDRVQIVAIERASGQVATWEDDHHADRMEPIIEWVEEVRDHAQRDPDAAPRDEYGPGISYLCDVCPFLTRCWGDDARPGRRGPQAADPTDVPAISSALALYRDAMRREREAKDDKAFAGAVIANAPKGVYGSHELRWKRGYDRQPTLDTGKAIDLLTVAGIDPPMKPGAHINPSPIIKAVRGVTATVVPPAEPEAVTEAATQPDPRT